MYKFNVGELVKIVRIIDDHKYQYVGLVGKVLEHRIEGYLIMFDTTGEGLYSDGHLFYEAELASVTGRKEKR